MENNDQKNSNTQWKEEYLNADGKWENGTPELENLFFDKIAIQIREVVNHFKEDNKGTPKRANHAKILAGFKNATFRILPSTESTKDLYAGFLIPAGKEYKNVTLRFSNASAEIVDDDSIPDLRGVALRIETEKGVHDFLMTNAELHHAKDAREAMVAIRAGVEKDIVEDLFPNTIPDGIRRKLAGTTGALAYLTAHLGFKGIHIATTLKEQMSIKVQSLSTETFWSRAPIAIGNIAKPEDTVAVKYRLRPAVPKPEQDDITAAKDLESRLLEELAEGDVKYYFEVQRYRNSEDTPIEDATKSWGDDSTFIPIAELIITKDSINEKESVNKEDFNPWNIDLEHFQPLGSMNRCRKKIYAAGVHERKNESEGME
jgi:hypothetical protein